MEKATSTNGIASKKEGVTEPKNRPTESFREDEISVSVWKREAKGRVFYTCSFERSYKDAAGQRQYTRYFGRDDLEKIVRLATRAREYLQGMVHPEPEPQAQ